MKTIGWFVLKQLDGSPIKLPNGSEVTMKEVLLSSLGGAQIKDGRRAITAYMVATKIYGLQEGNPLVLEDEEFNVLKAALESNPPQSPIVWGQLWKIISDLVG